MSTEHFDVAQQSANLNPTYAVKISSSDDCRFSSTQNIRVGLETENKNHNKLILLSFPHKTNNHHKFKLEKNAISSTSD